MTFLFTDIEGSTRLWEAHPEVMRGTLARHDDLMREAISRANGYVFKTIGDAFCAAFATAQEALQAVLAAQTALLAEATPPTSAFWRQSGNTHGTGCWKAVSLGLSRNGIWTTFLRWWKRPSLI